MSANATSAKPELTSAQLYLRLLRYLTPYRGVFAIAVLGMILVALSEAALPALMKPLLDGTFVDKDPGWMRWMPWLIVGIAAVRGMGTYVGTHAMSWVSNNLVRDLRRQMFERLLRLPSAYYADHQTGNLISKVTFDVTQVTSAATQVVLTIAKDAVIIVALLGYLLWLNWTLTLLSLVMTPLIAYVVRKLAVRLRRSSRDAQKSMGDMTQVLEEAIEGHKVVKLFGGQAYEAKRFLDEANRVRHFNIKQQIAAAANVPLTQQIAAIALAIIVYIAIRQSDTSGVTVGAFASFITGMLMLTAPLKRITSVSEHLQRGLAAAESVFELVDQPEEPDTGTVVLGRARGEIRFDGVTFRYSGASRAALDHVDLTIAPGETVALVGASGGGKTTLANLVPRFFPPTEGRILVDGHDLQTLTLASLRANIALVSQDVVLFNDTVAANIAYGTLQATREEDIVTAATAAHAMEFIREMPNGLATLIGENGVKLSGGQRQRLAIARALLKNAPILILDEATSALDSESERHVQAALETLMRDRTTLVIAHRLSTIERANRIVVLDTGRVAEVGSHRELLAAGGIYAKLYRIQFESQLLNV